MNEEEMSLEEQSDCDRCLKHFDYNSDDLIWSINAYDYDETISTAFEKFDSSALCKKCIRELSK